MAKKAKHLTTSRNDQWALDSDKSTQLSAGSSYTQPTHSSPLLVLHLAADVLVTLRIVKYCTIMFVLYVCMYV